MNKLLLILSLSIILSACQTQTTPTEIPTTQENTTLTGQLTATSPDKAVIQLEDGTTDSVESYAIDFTVYSGKTVQVTGQYSGTTLFVDQIAEVSGE